MAALKKAVYVSKCKAIEDTLFKEGIFMKKFPHFAKQFLNKPNWSTEYYRRKVASTVDLLFETRIFCQHYYERRNDFKESMEGWKDLISVAGCSHTVLGHVAGYFALLKRARDRGEEPIIAKKTKGIFDECVFEKALEPFL
jgi:hypothetical protein